MWGTIIDVVVIAIIIISAVVAIAKGLIDSVLSLFGTAIAVAGGAFLAKYVSPVINNIFGLEEFLIGKLNNVTVLGKTFSNVEGAKFCVWIITVIALFLIIKLALYIIAKVFESVTKNSPAVSGINRVLGMLFGIVKGGVIVVACLAICSLISGIEGIGTTINTKIGETKITKWAYNYVDEFVENNFTQEKVQDIIDRIISENENTDSETENNTENQTENTDTSTEGEELI